MKKLAFLILCIASSLSAGAQASAEAVKAPDITTTAMNPNVRLGVFDRYTADFANGRNYNFTISLPSGGGWADITLLNIGTWSTSLENVSPGGQWYRYTPAFGGAPSTIRFTVDPFPASGGSMRSYSLRIIEGTATRAIVTVWQNNPYI